MDDASQKQQTIHLLELVINHNISTRGHNLEIMNVMPQWMEKKN